jgi:hypothetical protein
LTLVGPNSYRVSRVAVRRGGTLVIDNMAGPVTLYVAEAVRLAGDVVVRHPDADRFAVYVTGERSITLTNFTGVVYAPEASVVVSGKGQVFGAIVGRKLALKGPVHYDEALRGKLNGKGNGT